MDIVNQVAKTSFLLVLMSDSASSADVCPDWMAARAFVRQGGADGGGGGWGWGGGICICLSDALKKKKLKKNYIKTGRNADSLV